MHACMRGCMCWEDMKMGSAGWRGCKWMLVYTVKDIGVD